MAPAVDYPELTEYIYMLDLFAILSSLSFIQIYSFKYIYTNIIRLYARLCFPRDIKILGWCPVGPVLPHGEKVPL